MPSAQRTPGGQGVIPVQEIYTSSKKIRGQHRAKPHSDLSSIVGRAWGRHPIVATLEASSRLTGEIVKVDILGPAERCNAQAGVNLLQADCHFVPCGRCSFAPDSVVDKWVE